MEGQKSLPVRVTNLNDHGPGSLREAIAMVSSGSAITFAKTLNEGGGISITGGYFIFITSSTIFANAATRDGGGIAIGNFPRNNSYYQLQTSMVTGNHAGLGPDISGQFTAILYDLIQDVSGTIINNENSTERSNIIGAPPDPGPLQIVQRLIGSRLMYAACTMSRLTNVA